MNKENKPTISHKLRLIDKLAHIRTVLANERTFLSYQRTALAQFAGGITFVHFFEGTVVKVVGGFLIVSAILTIFLGFWRYRKTKSKMEQIEEIPD